MPKKKNGFIPEEEEEDFQDTPVQTEKEKLQALHKQLTDLGVNRISQLENLISRAE